MGKYLESGASVIEKMKEAKNLQKAIFLMQAYDIIKHDISYAIENITTFVFYGSTDHRLYCGPKSEELVDAKTGNASGLLTKEQFENKQKLEEWIVEVDGAYKAYEADESIENYDKFFALINNIIRRVIGYTRFGTIRNDFTPGNDSMTLVVSGIMMEAINEL